jgi:hypothetical protein
MSSALAIAGVTSVIKDLLDNGLIDQVIPVLGAQFKTTAVPPDTIALGSDQSPQLNLFMWQATPNAAWRNRGYPSRDSRGNRISNPPLALDLHYLLTAYGSTDLQAEVLLGYAMQLLHETPVLPRDAIRKALNPPGTPVDPGLLPTIYQALRASDLADQFEQIKITQSPMNTEDTWKLWTALQAHYRPTASYTATVVLIESAASMRAALPVLTRGGIDPVSQRERGVKIQVGLTPPFAELERISFPDKRITALLGDTLTLQGHDLDGANLTLLLSNPRQDVSQTITGALDASATSVQFKLPQDPVNYPAGNYLASLQLDKGGVTVTTNTLTIAIAPDLSGLPASVALDVHGNINLTVNCSPQVRPTQDVTLILGDVQTAVTLFTVATATPSFVVPGLVPGPYWVRLRVDGVDSNLIDRNQSPPSFIASQQLMVMP